MNVKKMSIIILIFLFTIVLSACRSNKTPEEEIYTIIEKSVSLEAGLQNQQDPLVDLEEKEKKLYDQIISLGMKEFDKIVTLSNQALAILEEREDRIQKEKESIEASRKHFQAVLPIIDELEDDSLKKEAKGLYSLMEKRYQIYEKLYKNYLNGIILDKELYEMFQDKNVSLEELETQIEKINQTYEKVMNNNKEFNEYSEKTYEAKLAFYKHANLDIETNRENNLKK